MAFRLTNDDIEIVRHLTGTASCVRLISRRSSAARSIESTTTSPSGWNSLRELRVARSSDTQLFLFAMRANVRATGPLAHAWRDGGDQNYEKIAARKRTRHSRLDYAWVAPFCRLAIRFSQGAKWKALISKYIEVIPPGGQECSAVEQRISGWPPPRTPVSSAMIAKVGAAARYSQSDKERAAGYLLSECIAPAAHPAGWVLFKSFSPAALRQ